MKAPASRKTENFTFRVSPEEKAMIERAVALTGSDATQFVMAPAIERAHEITERQHVTILTGASREQFISLMLDPPAPSESLIENLRDQRHQIVE
jgi:uncharacterized protein (DUF1778 family)